MKRILIGAAVCLVLGAAAFVLAARSGALNPSEAELRAKYMLPTSKMIEIDGTPVHYADEGQGEVIILVHGTFGSLRMWEPWVAVLKDNYRIIRFDRPQFGLSGPDPKNRYGWVREAEIIEGLVAQLGLDKFYMGATSSGGQSVTPYAAKHPEQIKGLVLSNIQVKAGVADPYRNTWFVRQSRKAAAMLNGWHPEAEWRDVLKRNIVKHDRISDALVTEYAQLNNRPASYLATRAPRPPAVQTEADLAKVTAPTLLLWSEEDSERPPHPDTDDAMAALAAADKSVVIIPQCEHMMPLDCGPESAAAAKAFFDRVSAAASR